MWWVALKLLWWLIDWAGDLALGALIAFQVVGGTHEAAAPPATPPASEIAPPLARPQQQTAKGRRLVIRAGDDNQCYVEARANGAKFSMLLDTGASLIAFGPQHVKPLGLDASALRYDGAVSTANGTGRAADIRLKEFRIGDFVMRDVAALVVEGGLDTPLLGAPVLKLLHLEYAGGSCVLTLPRHVATPAGHARQALRD